MINPLKNPVKKGPLVNLVVERIKDALINKKLKPGDFLPSEADLAKNLGVGKSSVREALKMLQALGVVEVKRGHGTVICQHPGQDSVNLLIFQLIMEERNTQDIIDLRMVFEPAFTVMAMNRASDKEIRSIQKTVERLEKSIKRGTQKAEDDLAFHLAILHATHNPFIIRIGETIFQLFKSSINMSMRTIPEVALRDHKRIFKAFVNKDEDKLVEAVVASFEGWEMSLKKDQR